MAGWVAFGSLSYGAWQFVEGIISRDSLSPFRRGTEVPNPRDGVILREFQIKAYQGDVLTTEALVDRATIWKDRSTIDLVQITNGKFFSSDKTVYEFTANKASYGSYSKSMQAEGGVRLFNRQFDLAAQGFLYDHIGQLVTVNGDVAGTLEGGKIKAKDVRIGLKNKEILTGKIEWSGPLAVQGNQKTPWKVDAAKSSIRGDISTYINARGEDKDSIVKADKMTYDRVTDIVTAEGNVQYFGIDANIACDKIIIERKTGKATLTGKSIDMLIKPEDSAPKETQIPPVTPIVPGSIANGRPSPESGGQDDPVRQSGNIRQYPIALTAGRIEYWYKKGQRKAILTENPFARQELGGLQWRELTAARAEYDGEAEVLVLRSAGERLVRLKNSVGDDLTATFIRVSTKKGEDVMDAENLKGTVMINDDDLPERPGGGTSGSTGSTGSTGGTGLSGPIGG
jgi:lipopolysaccharide export system protein LptA